MFKEKKYKGFGLIELLISLAILFITLGGILVLFASGIRLSYFSQMGSVAVGLAQEKIEYLRSLPYNEISFGESIEDYGFLTDFPNFRRITNISCFDPNGLGFSPNCPETGIKKIEITVFWKGPVGFWEDNIKISTLVSAR